MKIRIDRPSDPELARLWDEARAEVAMRELLAGLPLERTDADCCRGDLRLCRCVPAEREAEDEEWMAATGGEE